MTIHEWQGRKIRVTAKAIPLMLWLESALTIQVDSDEQHDQPHFRLREEYLFSFNHQGRIASAKIVRTFGLFVTHLKYRMLIDRELVAESSVYIKHWWCGLVIMGGILAAILFSSLAGFFECGPVS